MIIFNLWAIPVAIVVYLVILGLQHFFPAVTADRYFPYTIGAVMIVIGVITDWVGVKARVFFLPVWLIGAAIICCRLGPIGWVLLGLIAVAGVIFLVRWTKTKSAEEWRKAQEEIVKSPNPPTLKEREFWNWVQTTLFFPLSSPSPEQCAHDLKVLQSIKNARPRLTSQEAARFLALEFFFDQNRNTEKCPSIPNEVEQAVSSLIKQKIKQAKPDASFQPLASAPPEAVPSR